MSLTTLRLRDISLLQSNSNCLRLYRPSVGTPCTYHKRALRSDQKYVWSGAPWIRCSRPTSPMVSAATVSRPLRTSADVTVAAAGQWAGREGRNTGCLSSRAFQARWSSEVVGRGCWRHCRWVEIAISCSIWWKWSAICWRMRTLGSAVTNSVPFSIKY